MKKTKKYVKNKSIYRKSNKQQHLTNREMSFLDDVSIHFTILLKDSFTKSS